jgi:mono/diheme cytochrome c family protein
MAARNIVLALVCAFGLHAVHGQEPDGAALFAVHCASCHGVDGEGGGPVAAVMTITVPNLRTLSPRSRGEYPSDAIAAYIDGREQRAAHGSRTMPVWGDFLRPGDGPDAEEVVRRRIAALVAFIERLQYR